MLIHAAAQQEMGLSRQVTVQTERRRVVLVLKNSSGRNGAPDVSGVKEQEEFDFPQLSERRRGSVESKTCCCFHLKMIAPLPKLRHCLTG